MARSPHDDAEQDRLGQDGVREKAVAMSRAPVVGTGCAVEGKPAAVYKSLRLFRTDAVEPLDERTPIRDNIRNFVIHEEGTLMSYRGKPFVFFGNWDSAENWSGESARSCASGLFLVGDDAKEVTGEEWLRLIWATHYSHQPQD